VTIASRSDGLMPEFALPPFLLSPVKRREQETAAEAQSSQAEAGIRRGPASLLIW
jgi:hypothetical protein